MASVLVPVKRHIVFFGETGTGKSSAINLLLGAGAPARVSNDAQPCTQASASYTVTLNGTKYVLWDTRGLSEGSKFLRFFGFGAEKELKKFLKERHQRREIDLLVYCVRGSRATEASVKYYKDFCAISRRLAAPVVILVTQLERELVMEDWWYRNSSRLKKLEMEFDGHACITTLQRHARTAESKKKLVDFITKKYRWQAQPSGSYFGSPVHVPKPSTAPARRGMVSNLFRAKYKANPIDGGIRSNPTNRPVAFRSASSTGSLSYHTAVSPGNTSPPSPIVDVEPPTPQFTASPVNISHIDTGLLVVSGSSQPPSEDTFSTGASLYSMFIGPRSTNTSRSEVHLEPCTEENEDYLMSELPFKWSVSTVKRRKSYATRQGAFGDIWECDLISGESSRMVAVKAVKFGTNDYDDVRSQEKKLRRELKIWAGLQHPNIVPLLGIVPDFGPLPSMVSPWFHNGSLSHYLAQNRLLDSKKHRMLGGIAGGLSYLHSQNIIHGDLHSDNVLIDDDGRACLTDFGLSLVNEFVGTSYLKSSICGAVQFADPALVQRVCKSQDVFHPTKPCDVYSFGGLVLHVQTGKKPYDGLPTHSIFPKVLEGGRPDIPTYGVLIAPWYKSLILKCWNCEEKERPSADDLVTMFAQ